MMGILGVALLLLLLLLLLKHVGVATASPDTRLKLLVLPSLQFFLMILLVLFECFFGRFSLGAGGLHDVQDGIKNAFDVFSDALIEVEAAASVLNAAVPHRVVLNDRTDRDLILKPQLLGVQLLLCDLGRVLLH